MCCRVSSIRKLSYKEGQELAGMEGSIEATEQELATLEARLADPTLYAERGDEVPALMAATENARTRVDAQYRRWEELEARR